MLKTAVVTLFLLTTLSLVVASCVPLDTASVAAADECIVQGAWVGNFPGGPWDTPLIFQNTVVAQDAAGDRLTYEMRWVNPDATLRNPAFEETDYASDFVGEAIRTGPKSYDYSLIGYGVKDRPGDRNEITYIFLVNGSLTCENEENVVSNVTLSVYPADQDADQDGMPDEGAQAMCIGPNDFGTAQRVPLMEPCEPPAE